MAITGVGTRFYKRVNDSWQSLAEVENITGPGGSRETVDTTHLATEGGYRTFIAGFRDSGTVDFVMNFERSEYELMKDDFESDDPQDYMIVLPDADNTSFIFQGLVTEIPLTIPPGDKVTVNVSIKISGPVTLDSGSASV